MFAVKRTTRRHTTLAFASFLTAIRLRGESPKSLHWHTSNLMPFGINLRHWPQRRP